MKQERNAEFGITEEDDDRIFDIKTPEPKETPENDNNSPLPEDELMNY